MSLRAAKSLPSLRTAFQQSVKETTMPPLPRQNIHTFSTTSVPFAPAPSKSAKPNLASVRNVHQTSKQNTILSGTNDNKYGSMNLQALKAECRSRKIKITGRKDELRQRLLASDQSNVIHQDNTRTLVTKAEKKRTTKQLKEFQKTMDAAVSKTKITVSPIVASAKAFSTSVKVGAKGDSSSVDDAKFPSADYVEPEKQTSAPSLLSKNPVKEIDVIDTKTKIAEMEGAVSIGPDNEGEVASFQSPLKDFKIDEAAGASANAGEDSKFEPNEGEIESRDKYILGGILGAVIGWWAIKPKSHKN